MCSFFAIHTIVSGGHDLDIVGKAKQAAGPIFEIIDTVCTYGICNSVNISHQFAMYVRDQVPTINVNIDKGIIPDKPCYTITIKDVTFAYPARPDTMVRMLIVGKAYSITITLREKYN